MLLLGVCMKYLKNEEEAKDCVQQVFLKAITELNKYKVDYFKSWLYMVAKNTCLMKLRQKGNRPLEINEQLLSTPDETEDIQKYIDNQQLMDYLSNRLSKTENHEVEKNMAEDEFMNDAVEGLQIIENKKDMQAYVEQLNSDLKKQIAKNKKRKDKLRLKDNINTY